MKISRTTGLPKSINGHGSRGIVVPLIIGLGNMSKDMVALGRIPGQQKRNQSNTAGDPSIVESNAIRKLRWLEEKCIQDQKFTVDGIYNLMYSRSLYELAYQDLKSKPGNMTQGISPTTLDGFSTEIIDDIIGKMKDNSFKFAPGRRVMIPKASGGERPLTVAPPRDKIVQEVMRRVLEVIFEPSFSPNSHGFRPHKSCHTALREIHTKFGVATWYIEGDISKCFDSFDHEILMGLIRTRIKDERFIRLIYKAIKAGYFEFRIYKHSITGTPQGSIISPILANIYLNELDKVVNHIKESFDKGLKPKENPIWISYRNKKNRTESKSDKLKWHKLMMSVPSKDPMNDSFKKLVYIRYADDWIIGVRGSHDDCVMILQKIRSCLKDTLKLNLSDSKTLITNANLGKALFLGTHLFRSRVQVYSRYESYSKRAGKEIRLEAPLDRIVKKLTEAGFIKNGKAQPKFLWLHNSKDQIIALYNSVYRGFINYYSFSHNLGSISGYLNSNLKASCAKLLAAKFTMSSQKSVFEKFGKNLLGDDKISFVEAKYKRRPWDFKLPSDYVDTLKTGNIQSLYAETVSIASLENLVCSVCKSDHRVEMHHVRFMKDLNPKLSKIDQLMVKRRRKQIALCRSCHMKHHSKNTISSS